ncbi:type II secretion system protein [Pseudarthrobacter chlorophenolicus A6]|uniref:Type II secretion system protein n=1 Tax=Pseudarthrobacter chlorophenolicus (strain ATCC 700700 / DSM 12829 / CIP 107037 / JCM 12360 / KCTC 9906 / NCIMB 13794 / A6) TaxID=452863 RepID=B8HBI3_PSECP|nr:type II secretion system F family protein [Pseudarthrobacter chlorophenolicus]ACL40371.1 type II secretion system protein [Pseudarthrobacter chlorophenolicus A6]SDQ82788.1 tight adherence protein C [Pseudarthrobacter chlorophenolicus]
MITVSPAAAVCGAVLGIGLWLVIFRSPIMRATTLAQRIEPQLKSQNLESRLLSGEHTLTPFGPLERILRPFIRDGIAALGKMSPAPGATARRLAQAGINKSVIDFRAEQVIWAAAGFALTSAIVAVGAAAGRFNALLAAVAIIGSGISGFIVRDYWLGVQVRRREERMMAEFPSLAELMALAVGAGESATGALDRVCRSARGELSKEFSTILAETRAGKPLVNALQEFSARTDLAPLVRFVDGIVVAVERGTPLADVLRAQAQDVRDTAKRDLMEAAGKKEIAMMVPLVFGVLPLTVVFAVFPGISAISLGL